MKELTHIESALGGRTGFVQELMHAQSTQTKMTFMICTWTAMIVHSNPVSWTGTDVGSGLNTLKSVVVSVNDAPEMLVMERQCDFSGWKQLRADLKMPMPPAAVQAAGLATASGQASGANSGENLPVAPISAPAFADAAEAPVPASGPSVLAAAAVEAEASTAAAAVDHTLNTGLAGDDPSDAALTPAPAFGLQQATDALAESPGPAVAAASGQEEAPILDGLPYSPGPVASPSQETVPALLPEAPTAADTFIDDAAETLAECEEAARIVAASSTVSDQNALAAPIVAHLARHSRVAKPMAEQNNPRALATVALASPAPAAPTASGQQALAAAAPAEEPESGKRRRVWAATALKSAPACPPAPAPPASTPAPPTTGTKRKRGIKQIEGQAGLAMFAAVQSPASSSTPKPAPAVVPAALALPPPPVRATSAAPATTASGQPPVAAKANAAQPQQPKAPKAPRAPQGQSPGACG